MPGIRQTLHEFKHHELHSGSKHGPIVTSRAQAIAIALHEGKSDRGGPQSAHSKAVAAHIKSTHKR